MAGAAFHVAHEFGVEIPESLESAKHFVETAEQFQIPRDVEGALSSKETAEAAAEFDQLVAEPSRSVAIGGPEVEAQIELREAWQAERDVLLEKQAGEIVKAETMAAIAKPR